MSLHWAILDHQQVHWWLQSWIRFLDVKRKFKKTHLCFLKFSFVINKFVLWMRYLIPNWELRSSRYHSTLEVDSLWPSKAIWQHRSGSTLDLVMACCLTTPSHYLHQCSLFIGEVLWHSPESDLTEGACAAILCNENHTSEITDTSPRHQWVHHSGPVNQMPIIAHCPLEPLWKITHKLMTPSNYQEIMVWLSVKRNRGGMLIVRERDGQQTVVLCCWSHIYAVLIYHNCVSKCPTFVSTPMSWLELNDVLF